MMIQLFFSNPSLSLQASKQTSRWLAYGLSLMIVFLSLAISVKAQNNVLNFDGSNDYVTILHNAALKPATNITVEAWIFVNNITGNRYYEIARKEDGNDRILFSFQEFGTVLSFGLGVGGSYSELDVTITASDYVNRWVHVAAVYNGTQKIIYRNGVVIGTQNVTGAIGTAGSNPLLLGADGSGGGPYSFFNGNMDEFRFWNVARTQAQIQSGMTGSLTGSESGLVAYYNFNEGTSGANNTGITAPEIQDLTANNFDGTLTNFAKNGNTSNWVGSRTNALNFDGSNDYVIAPVNGTALTTLTIEMWVNRTGGSSKGIFQWANTLSAGGPMVYFYDDGSNFQLYVDGNYRNTISLATGTWTHIAVTYNGTVWTTYKDGVSVHTYTGGISFQTNALSLYFANGFNGYWNGKMDEVRIWNVARTAGEISTNMNTELTGSETGLVAYYKLNEGTADGTNTGVTTAFNLAGCNNGTLTNFALTGTTSNWTGGQSITTVTDPIKAEINVTVGASGSTTNVGGYNTGTNNDFTYTVQNTGGMNLSLTGSPRVVVSGATNATFTVTTQPSTPVSAGGSSNFTIHITPTGALGSTFSALFTIANSDCDEGSYTFTLTGKVINATPSGVRGNMFKGDGTDDKVDLGNVNIFAFERTNSFTLECWFKTSSNTNSLFTKINQTFLTGYGLGINTGRINFSLVNTPGFNLLSVQTNNTFADNNWHHVACTYNGNSLASGVSIYVDGVLQTTTPLFNSLTASILNTEPVYLGASLNGNMDEARIWNTVRSQNEIRDNMHLTLLGSESGLIGYYQFNESSGNVIDAIAGSNGTLIDNGTRELSTVSVAKGVSNRQAISTGAANYNFTGTNCSLNFTAVGTAGEIVVNRLEGSPFGTQLAGTFSVYARYYWVINNYGTTGFSTTPTFILGPNQISAGDETAFTNLKLNKRDTNNGLGWTQINGTSATASTGSVSFGAITSFSEFGVTSNGSSPLPITLIQFNASRINAEEVQLTWATATEINNKGFEVEQSEDGLAFEKIAFIDGRGNSVTIQQYSHITLQPSSNYFRLKQVDMDGKFSYSPIRYVEGTANKLYFAPNPSTNEVHLQGNIKADEILNLEVVGTDGQILWRGKGKATEVENSLNIALKNFKAGLYLFRLQANGKMTVQKMVKQ